MNKVWFGVYTRKVSFSIINRVWWFGVYTRKVGFSMYPIAAGDWCNQSK